VDRIIFLYLTSCAVVAHTRGDAGDNQVDETIAYLICAVFLIRSVAKEQRALQSLGPCGP